MNRITRLSFTFVAALVSASGAALAQTAADTDAVFTRNQYTALYQQGLASWHALPVEGPTFEARADTGCANAVLPIGVWLVTVGVDGKPELVAPSGVLLADGQPDRIPLRACGDLDGHAYALHAPQPVFDYLLTAGSLYVAE